MRLEQLQSFLAVAETNSFQKASRRCQVTQSAISRQIQALEANLGLRLFHRGAKVRLTLGGEQLLPWARKICQEWQTAQEQIQNLLHGERSDLCIAAVPSICTYYLPPIIHSFYHSYPRVQLRVTALGSDRAVKVLKDGLVDVAVVMQNPFLVPSAELVVQPLFEESIRVLMAASHPLSTQTSITWETLATYPQVVFKDGYGMQRLVREQFQRRGLPLQAALELNIPEAFRGVLRQGIMVALLPESCLGDAGFDQTLAVRSLALEANEAPLVRRIVLVTTQDRLHIPPIRDFHRLVLELQPPQVGYESRVPHPIM